MSHNTSFMFRVAIVLNAFVLLVFLISIFGFLSFKNFYGFFLASVTTLIAYGVFKHKRWGYFAAAAWSLACYQLAKQGYEFQSVKRLVMTLGFLLIPICVFLHEVLAKKISKSSDDAQPPA